MGSHPLITAWRRFDWKKCPYVLDGDETLLDGDGAVDSCVHRSYPEYIRSPAFGITDGRLHLGLLPMPFVGNLERASIYILMLNPGVGPHDYFGEYGLAEYSDALLRNLRQARGSRMMFLEPVHSWHGGSRYWTRKLGDLIHADAERRAEPYLHALGRFAAALATIELVPYHSPKFDLPGRVVRNLRSAELARDYVRNVLVRRAKVGDCLVVVARQAKAWGLEPSRNVVVYSPSEARAAHLSRRSPGGMAILKFLRDR